MRIAGRLVVAPVHKCMKLDQGTLKLVASQREITNLYAWMPMEMVGIKVFSKLEMTEQNTVSHSGKAMSKLTQLQWKVKFCI